MSRRPDYLEDLDTPKVERRVILDRLFRRKDDLLDLAKALEIPAYEDMETLPYSKTDEAKEDIVESSRGEGRFRDALDSANLEANPFRFPWYRGVNYWTELEGGTIGIHDPPAEKFRQRTREEARRLGKDPEMRAFILGVIKSGFRGSMSYVGGKFSEVVGKGADFYREFGGEGNFWPSTKAGGIGKLAAGDTLSTNSGTRYYIATEMAPIVWEELIDKGGISKTEKKTVKAGEFEVPNELFDPIVGYEEVKERFKRSLSTGSVRQSILLIGPPASAKTIFLEEVARLKGIVRISGRATSEAGFEDKIIERPNFIIIDEFDELNGDVLSVLLNYQDPRQDFSITKSGKMDTIENKPPIFASANSVKGIPAPNLDRFWKFTFNKYTDDEFRKICQNLLPRDFGVDENLSVYIADELRNFNEDSTVRDSERIAEVCETKEEVDDEIEILKEYSSK